MVIAQKTWKVFEYEGLSWDVLESKSSCFQGLEKYANFFVQSMIL